MDLGRLGPAARGADADGGESDLRSRRGLQERGRTARGIALYTNALRSNRPRDESKGFQRSPTRATRAGTFRIVKSSRRIPRSTSFQVTGVDTVASGRGRTE